MADLAKLNICFIAGTLGAGGAERQLLYILHALKNAGTSLRLLTLSQGEYWEKAIRAMDIPVYWVGRSRSRLGRLLAIVHCLKSNPPDVIQSQHFYTNLYSTAAARILGVREIGAVRGDVKSELRANGKVMGGLSLQLPRMLALNSRQAILNACAAGARCERLCYLPNVVDPQAFQRVRRCDQEPIVVLSVGRLHALKRQDLFLETVARLRSASKREIRAVIVGEGNERARLQRRAEEFGLLPEIVTFAGHLADARQVYQQADLLILTSDWEGTPNVILEAMAAGLPVVATAVGGVAEVVADGETGFVVPARDIEAITARALELIADGALRRCMGLRGREYVLAHHAPDILPANLQSLYEAALA